MEFCYGLVVRVEPQVLDCLLDLGDEVACFFDYASWLAMGVETINRSMNMGTGMAWNLVVFTQQGIVWVLVLRTIHIAAGVLLRQDV